MDESIAEQLYRRAWDRLDGRAVGCGEPILRHLALRNYAPALVALSHMAAPGRLTDTFSSEGLAYRAFRRGDTLAAYNLAIEHFNRGRMADYRRWLARAASAGDVDASRELRRFELRLPHADAANLRRKRPYRKYD